MRTYVRIHVYVHTENEAKREDLLNIAKHKISYAMAENARNKFIEELGREPNDEEFNDLLITIALNPTLQVESFDHSTNHNTQITQQNNGDNEDNDDDDEDDEDYVPNEEDLAQQEKDLQVIFFKCSCSCFFVFFFFVFFFF